ncbi:MAG: RNA polymerase sigma factor [Micrococcales bacterium]|nr:RNA polymerase sigma factor [Actinomycetota bacterium]NCA07581.1 RNA polymerase sigma factor [Micrococcales bacterium]
MGQQNHEQAGPLPDARVADLGLSREKRLPIDISPEQARKVEEFELVVSPFYDKIRRACISKTSNFAKGEDLAQEVIYKAFKSWQTYQDQGKGVMPWINMIIKNTNINVGIKESAHDKNRENVYLNEEGVVDFGFDKAPVSESAEDIYFEQLSVQQVRDAIEKLDPEFSEAVMLSLVAEWTYQEIADHLEIPISTVGTKIFRGRSLLRKLLAQQAHTYGFDANHTKQETVKGNK